MGDLNGLLLAQDSEFVEFLFMIIVMAVAALGGLLKSRNQQKQGASQKRRPNSPPPTRRSSSSDDDFKKNETVAVGETNLPDRLSDLLRGSRPGKRQTDLASQAQLQKKQRPPTVPQLARVSDLPGMQQTDTPQEQDTSVDAIQMRLSGEQIKDAILLKEILDEPLALRDYR